VALRILGRG